LRRGKKIDLKKRYEPWVVENFSGYLCIDEVYDGAYVIYYAVDPVSQCRVAFQISYQANEEETRRFVIYLKEMGLSVKGITTDGSHLYPKPLAEIFPSAKHQICYFHILKEINQLALRCLARFRKSLPRPPKRSRGRPRKGQRYRLSRLEKLRREIWEARYLWVQHYLTPAQRKKLQRLYRGQPFLRSLRELIDLVYGLFDRRCSVERARQKLEQLRQKKLWQELPLLLPIWKKLRSSNLEKALTFLDDDLLEGTSNAVERVNRGHRKFQKTIYRVRTERTIAGRIKYSMILDRLRASPEQAEAGFICIRRNLRYAS
jgi:hypothetical protein